MMEDPRTGHVSVCGRSGPSVDWLRSRVMNPEGKGLAGNRVLRASPQMPASKAIPNKRVARSIEDPFPPASIDTACWRRRTSRRQFTQGAARNYRFRGVEPVTFANTVQREHRHPTLDIAQARVGSTSSISPPPLIIRSCCVWFLTDHGFRDCYIFCLPLCLGLVLRATLAFSIRRRSRARAWCIGAPYVVWNSWSTSRRAN
jgi:hypothetical protein